MFVREAKPKKSASFAQAFPLPRPDVVYWSETDQCMLYRCGVRYTRRFLGIGLF